MILSGRATVRMRATILANNDKGKGERHHKVRRREGNRQKPQCRPAHHPNTGQRPEGRRGCQTIHPVALDKNEAPNEGNAAYDLRRDARDREQQGPWRGLTLRNFTGEPFRVSLC